MSKKTPKVDPPKITTTRFAQVSVAIAGVDDGNFVVLVVTRPSFAGEPVSVRLSLDEAGEMADGLNLAVAAVTAAKTP